MHGVLRRRLQHWALWGADEVDEEDRRPTQRRRMEEAQAGGFDENMEPLVRRDLSYDITTPAHQVCGRSVVRSSCAAHVRVAHLLNQHRVSPRVYEPCVRHAGPVLHV